MIIRYVLSLAMALLAAAACSGATITVDDDGPAHFSTIQAGINNASDGDVIVVQPGTYREQVTFNGRRVTVRSANPDDPTIVRTTVITRTSGASVVFDFSENSQSVLQGFTVTGRGIYCAASSPTIRGNVIRDCAESGITGERRAAPTIVGNSIRFCALEGIYACDGLIQGNTIQQNSAGIAFCSGPIRDNLIAQNGNASGLYFCDGEIAGNVIVANFSATQGGGLYQCNGWIHNNVIAGNRATGAGGGLFACIGPISNNTVVGNISADAGGGLSQCSGFVSNNIIAFNSASLGGGIFGKASSAYNAFWSNTGGNLGGDAIVGIGDSVTNPQFAQEGHWDGQGTPEGDDDVWIDGDYHLKSQAGRWDPVTEAWVVDAVHSKCIDGADPTSDWSAELWPHGMRANIGAYGGTPRASWSLLDLGLAADLDLDARVGPRDLQRFCEKWLAQEVLLAEDMDRNGVVDFADFALLALSWREGSTTPTAPTPDPMTWATPPFAVGTSTIAMVATTATSTDGTGVQYYFEDYYAPQFNSGWLTFAAGQQPRWEDTGLPPEVTVTYRVKARNRGNQLETGWSELASATTAAEDATAPLPNPATWEEPPHPISSGTIRMVATAATDASGVEYQFECTSHPNRSSGWQDSRVYEVSSLPRGQYTFRTRTRDKSPNHNTTAFSTEVTADLEPPTPDPMQWEMTPTEINIGGGAFTYYATMKAVEATDNTEDVQYYFQCTTEPSFSSGWQTSREYTVLVGRRSQFHRFRVKARDLSGNETGWSSELRSE
ncbi:MAG: right-handed parallel beta-helix repeat-containing protein [Sedimentisphaerales bacterium]|nr:right-handed parallel beta-helix repeat-containing protein [Sedimentisphaerales bacterium]